MKLNQLMEKIDRLKPNAFDNMEKTSWISNLDGRFNMEILQKENWDGYAYPEDGDKFLLIPPPFDNIYEYYLSAMIDYYNREYNSYNNTIALFNEGVDEYLKYLRRSHLPNQPTRVLLGGIL